MTDTPREVSGEHQKNKDLVFRMIPATYELPHSIAADLGRATERREVFVDLKVADTYAVLITRKVPLPARSGGGVS